MNNYLRCVFFKEVLSGDLVFCNATFYFMIPERGRLSFTGRFQSNKSITQKEAVDKIEQVFNIFLEVYN